MKITVKFAALWGLAILSVFRSEAQCSIDAGTGISICNGGQNVTLTATTTGGNPNSFSWTSNPPNNLPPTRSITVSPAVTTTYYVFASGNGCSAVDTVLVTVGNPPATPSFTFSPNNSCSSAPVTFNAASQTGIIYGWDFGDGSTATGNNVLHGFKSYGTGTGNFTVTLTDTNAAGCTNSSTQTINIIQGPAPLLLGGSGVDTMTFNGNLTFYKCAAAAQQNAQFTFFNSTPPAPGLTYQILWGDTGAHFNSDTLWTSVNHIYNRGYFDLSYIVTNTLTGCTDTTVYKVFYGSNPSGGIASPGNTDICGPGTLTFVISNYQNNSPGTIYTIAFNDSTPAIIFNHPPPDTITHLFQKSSCGVSSSNGVTVFNNSFAASLTVQNPCGLTAGAVLPIYVSLPPIANYAPPQNVVCTGTNQLYINTTIGGMAASSSGCNNATPILWHLTPSTGWTITTGNLGSDNGFTGNNFNPGNWTTGSNALGVSFTTAGTYQMRLVAANSCGPDTIIKTICVASPPSPTMSISGLSGTNGCAPVTVTATNTSFDTSTCSAASFAWAVTKVSAVCTPDLANDYSYTNHTDSISDTASIIFNNQGTYTLALNATNVCGTYSSNQTVNVSNPPQVSIAAPAAICIGQAVTPTSNSSACGGTISSYSWSIPGGTPSSSTNQSPGSVTLGAIGNYTISLAVANECGSASANQNLAVMGIPVANAGNDETLCSGNGVQIGSTPVNGLIYSWIPVTGLSSANVSNPTLTLTNAGTSPVVYTYYLTVSNLAGCSSTDSVSITVYPAAWVNAGPAINVCLGQPVALTGTFGGTATSVTWTSSGGGTFVSTTTASTTYTPPLSIGTVTLTLTSNTPVGPCPAVNNTTTVTVLAAPIAVTGPDTSVCSGSSVRIGGNSMPGYTYTWSPSTGLSNVHSSKPMVTLVNNGSNAITQTYQLVVSATGCADTAYVTVSVYPQPGANAGPDVTVCTGGSVTLNGNISGSATSAQWSSASGSFNPAGSLTTVFTPSINSGIAVATLTTTQGLTGCPSAVSNVSITITSAPSVTNTPLVQDICSGSATQDLNLTANIPGTTFSWTGAGSNGVTGFIISGNSSVIPAQTLNNTSSTIESVNYLITPAANGCTGATANFNITIEPKPQISAINPQTVCSGAASVAVAPNSTVTGTSYSWQATAGPGLSGYYPNGTGNIPSQTIINSGNQVDSVVYSITPTANGCSGIATRFVLMVEPQLQTILPASQNICSGGSSSLVNLYSNITGGVSFNWVATGTSGISGFAASGSGNVPSEILTNTSTTPGTITYSISASTMGCSGPSQNYTITVNPLPVATASPASPSVCSGTQVNIDLSSNIGGANFNWTVSAGNGVTGATSGSGGAIQQTLTNTSQSVQTVSYFITPSANGCGGNIDTEIVTVYPVVNFQLSNGNQNLCSGQQSQAVLISSPTSGASVSWTSHTNGISGVAASGTDSIPAQILVNNFSNPLTVDYAVTVSYAGCAGATGNYQITVNPEPVVAMPAPQTICSGTTTTTVVISSGMPGTTFAWTASSNDSISGYIPSGTGAIIPSQTLYNTSSLQGSVVYSIIPTMGGCSGAPVLYNVLVNPELVLAPVSPQTICVGSKSGAVTPVSNVQNVTFYWTGIGGPYLSGYEFQGTGTIPGQAVVNSGNSMDSLVYTIIPNAAGCSGNSANFVIYVNPVPQVISPLSQAICSGQQSSPVHLSGNVNGTVFYWTAVASANLSGYAASGSGDIPVQTIVNGGTADDSVIYSIIPMNNSCPGPEKKYKILIHPNSIINVTPASASICSGNQTSISLSSSVAGTTFNWLVNASSSISGAVNGSGNTITQVLTNNSLTPDTVTYFITTGGAACPGNPTAIHVIVTPGINIQFSNGPQSLCSGQSTQAVSLSSSVSGVSFSWVSQSNGITGVATSGYNIIPVQTLVNSNQQIDSVNYLVTASSPACPSQTADYIVSVKPNPVITLPAPQKLCSGASINNIHFNSDIAGSTYSWTSTASSGISGFTASGAADTLPSFTILNSTLDTGSIVFNITAANDGCSSSSAAYTILVYPNPDIHLPAVQSICNGSATLPVTFTSGVAGTVFNWTVSNNNNVTGAINAGTGTIPSQTLHNASPVAGFVTYTITPSAGNCAGVSANYTDTVYPTPTVIAPAPQVVCSGQMSNPVTLNSATPGALIHWTAAIPSGISGALLSGSNTIAAQTLYNNRVDTFPVALTINYTLSASVQGSLCPAGNSNLAITVLPKPQVSFIPSVNNGCSPLNVAFKAVTLNYGQPDSLVFIWGDGSANTTIYPSAINPEWYSVNHTFYNNISNAVIYNVKMKASNGCFDTIVSRPVTVMPNAVNTFFTAAPNTGCEPLVVKFQDQSSGASILDWCFNYNIARDSCMGGGMIDTAGSTITKTFAAGTYTVVLYAISGYGCAHDTAYQTIVVSPAPVAAFAVPAVTCEQSDISFTAQNAATQDSVAPQYAWQFGDGGSSLNEQAVHTFNTAGIYNVCLSVTSDMGCAGAVCHPVTIGKNPAVDFTANNGCVNQQQGRFTNLSNGLNSYYWIFGDGAASTSTDPEHIYLSAGNYQVKLIGTSNGCTDTAEQNISIYPAPHAAFTTPAIPGCGLPAFMPLKNTSTGAIAYEWNLGNGTNSEFENPVAEYDNDGNYTIMLVASNAYNCMDTATGPVVIYPKPDISANTTPISGCQPLPAVFTVTASNATAYVWNFGDGSTLNTSVPFATHLYADSGSYVVTLEAYSQGSCGDTMILPNLVTVHSTPTAGFDYLEIDSAQLNNGTIQFENTSVNSLTYQWDFGDGSISTDVNPEHMFADVNNFEVMLIATNSYGCKDTALKSLEIIKKSLYVPNAFAPEYSGPNSLIKIWKPAGIGLRTYHAAIYDKWGEILWQSDALTDELEPAEGWDGYYQGKLCQQGAYVWKIEATFVDGTIWTGSIVGKEKIRKTIGSVTLIR